MSFMVSSERCRAAHWDWGVYERTGRDLETGLYGRSGLANTSERLRQLSKCKPFNAERLINRNRLNGGLIYAEGIIWIRRLHSFLSNSLAGRIERVPNTDDGT